MTTQLRELIAACLKGLYERDEAVRLSLLAALAGESVFFLGPPGVGKSLIARRLKFILRAGKSFEYLMGKFSTPDEIFGPVSIQKLSTEDLYVRSIEGYLPDADIVFLDEVWNASPPIQNALLTAMNEKRFRNGNEEIAIPMTLLVGASNNLHPGQDTAAFWDRFLVRLVVEPIQNTETFRTYLEDETDPYADPIRRELKLSREDLEAFQAHLPKVALSPPVIQVLSQVRERFAEEGSSSDRRWKKIVRLVKASALAHGRTSANLVDCFLAEHCLWDSPEQAPLVRDIVQEAVAESIQTLLGGAGQAAERAKNHQKTLQQQLAAESTEEREVPLVVDGEYFQILPAAGEFDELRVWRPDGLELLERERLTELFGYKKQKLVRTFSANAGPGKPKRGKGIAVSIQDTEGNKFDGTLQTKKEKVAPTSWEDLAAAYRANSKLQTAETAAQTTEVLADLRRARAELDGLDRELRDQAAEHLFVAADRAKFFAEPLERAMADLQSLDGALSLLEN